MLLSALVHGHFVEVNITVPPFEVANEAYVCTTIKLPESPYRLVGVNPVAEASIVHHILLFGCVTPYVLPTGSQPAVWDCTGSSPCSSSQAILYGWGKNADSLQLPEDTSFPVGPLTSIAYVVAQVHYLTGRPANDASGVTLRLKPHATPKTAGVISYASNFIIPGGYQSYMVPNECCYQGFQPLNVIGVRVHTHTLGRRVWMERQTSGRTDVVYSGDPQLPQAFYPVTGKMLFPGDRLKVTCEFNSSSRILPTFAGPTHEYEMCNMYVMVSATLPYLDMCANGAASADSSAPGSLQLSSKLVADPFPAWHPPQPEEVVMGGGRVGTVTGVTMAPDGTMWALHRGSRDWDGATFTWDNRATATEPIPEPCVLQLDPDTGSVLQRWGAGIFYMPHMITLDNDGNVWVTDVALHQVLKFSANGTLLLTVGTKLTPGADAHTFCKPAQVHVLRDGRFLVADGYCNARVTLHQPDGSLAGEARFEAEVVHSVVADECADLVYAADREGRRVYKMRLSDMAVIVKVDLSSHGQVWSLRQGPYGAVLALCWERDKQGDATLVNLNDIGQPLLVPGLNSLYPHDMALVAAPAALTGPAERLLALVVAPTCAGCPALQRLVVLPPGPAADDPGKWAVDAGAAAAAALAKEAALQGVNTTGGAKGEGQHGDGGGEHEHDDGSDDEHEDGDDGHDDDHGGKKHDEGGDADEHSQEEGDDDGNKEGGSGPKGVAQRGINGTTESNVTATAGNATSAPVNATSALASDTSGPVSATSAAANGTGAVAAASAVLSAVSATPAAANGTAAAVNATAPVDSAAATVNGTVADAAAHGATNSTVVHKAKAVITGFADTEEDVFDTLWEETDGDDYGEGEREPTHYTAAEVVVGRQRHHVGLAGAGVLCTILGVGVGLMAYLLLGQEGQPYDRVPTTPPLERV